MEKPVLYSHWKSSCSWLVRTALSYKGIDYELRTIDIDKGEQHNAEYSKLNPNGFVPTFLHQGDVLCESMAILEYLEETFPKPQLLPSNSAANRALVRSLCMNIISGIQPLQIPRVYECVSKEKAEQMQFVRKMINNGFEAMEKRLSICAGKFCVGDELTLADLCLLPQVYNAINKFGMNISQYPTIERMYESTSQLDIIQPAHPSNQPDKPTNIKKL